MERELSTGWNEMLRWQTECTETEMKIGFRFHLSMSLSIVFLCWVCVCVCVLFTNTIFNIGIECARVTSTPVHPLFFHPFDFLIHCSLHSSSSQINKRERMSSLLWHHWISHTYSLEPISIVTLFYHSSRLFRFMERVYYDDFIPLFILYISVFLMIVIIIIAAVVVAVVIVVRIVIAFDTYQIYDEMKKGTAAPTKTNHYSSLSHTHIHCFATMILRIFLLASIFSYQY